MSKSFFRWLFHTGITAKVPARSTKELWSESVTDFIAQPDGSIHAPVATKDSFQVGWEHKVFLFKDGEWHDAVYCYRGMGDGSP